MESGRIKLMVLALVVVASTSLCAAQASYSESFDDSGPVNAGQHGPANLIASGWIFRNQSQPAGSGTWHADTNAPQAGSASLTVEDLRSQYSNSTPLGPARQRFRSPASALDMGSFMMAMRATTASGQASEETNDAKNSRVSTELLLRYRPCLVRCST